MKPGRCLLLLPLLALALSARPVAAQDAETLTAQEVAARCTEALGGEGAWRALETLEITGHHTSFSQRRPFRLLRARPNLYRFDHNDSSHDAVSAFDGRRAWWQKDLVVQSRVDWPVVTPQTFDRSLRADAEFEPPLVDWQAKGHRLELRGLTELDLEPFLEVVVTREGLQPERWLLDPETFLPAVRLSEGAYLPGRPWVQTSYFSDYRPVAGVLMPFRTEIELGNDQRVLEIEEVRANAEIERSLFSLPLPAGMERLQDLVGRWQVMVESQPLPILPWMESAGESTITADFGGALLHEELTYTALDFPWRVRRQWSWDRFQKAYRLVSFDNFTGHADVLEGAPGAEGTLVLSNLGTGTAWSVYERTTHSRETLRLDVPEEGAFRLEREVSTDGGTSWRPDLRLTYRRITP